MNTTSHEPRVLGYWLKATVTQKTYFPMMKVKNLAQIVYAMFFLGLIEKETLDKCTSLTWAPGEVKRRGIDMMKTQWQERLFGLLKPIYKVFFRILSHEKRFKKQGVGNVEDLLKYLTRFSVPYAIYNAELAQLEHFDEVPCFYDDTNKRFYYLQYPDPEESSWRNMKPTMVKVIDMTGKDVELVYGKGEVFLYGVDKFFFDEEKKRLLFNLPNLQSIYVIESEKDSNRTLFLPNRRLMFGDDISLFDFKEEVIPERERRGGKIGGFCVDRRGDLIDVQMKYLCEGTYDAVAFRVVDTENAMRGIVYYECRDAQYVVLLPPEAKGSIIDQIKQMFNLHREKAVFRFHNEDYKVVGEVESLPEEASV